MKRSLKRCGHLASNFTKTLLFGKSREQFETEAADDRCWSPMQLMRFTDHCVCSINCDIGEIWSVHFENVVRNVGIRENIRDSPLTGNGWMELCIIASRLQEASMNCRDVRTILIQVLLKNERLWSFFLKSNSTGIDANLYYRWIEDVYAKTLF